MKASSISGSGKGENVGTDSSVILGTMGIYFVTADNSWDIAEVTRSIL